MRIHVNNRFSIHFAVSDAICPKCKSNINTACKDSGSFLPRDTVHIERVNVLHSGVPVV